VDDRGRLHSHRMIKHNDPGALVTIGSVLLALAVGVATPAAQPTPAILFEDVTDRAGLTTRLDQNPTADKHMIETMAGGLAVFDYDDDGLPDIFFTNGAELPSLKKRARAAPRRC
jgi:hypothetical protein